MTDLELSVVNVLLLSWKEDNLGVKKEFRALSWAFGLVLGYLVESYKIPSYDSNHTLKERIEQWVRKYGVKGNTNIVYYVSYRVLDPDRGLIWLVYMLITLLCG